MCPAKQCSKCLFNLFYILLAEFQQLPDILQIDAVLPAHPCHRARRQQLAARTRTQFCQLAAFTTQPTTEGIATHSCGICQLIFVHRFHATITKRYLSPFAVGVDASERRNVLTARFRCLEASAPIRTLQRYEKILNYASKLAIIYQA